MCHPVPLRRWHGVGYDSERKPVKCGLGCPVRHRCGTGPTGHDDRGWGVSNKPVSRGHDGCRRLGVGKNEVDIDFEKRPDQIEVRSAARHTKGCPDSSVTECVGEFYSKIGGNHRQIVVRSRPQDAISFSGHAAVRRRRIK